MSRVVNWVVKCSSIRTGSPCCSFNVHDELVHLERNSCQSKYSSTTFEPAQPKGYTKGEHSIVKTQGTWRLGLTREGKPTPKPGPM
ncbi:hypothetical protein AB1N83_003957 [Pleurotus pulmonarius]